MDVYSIDNFIYIKKNVLSNQDCEAIIKDGLVYVDLNPEEVVHGKMQFTSKGFGRDDFQLFIPRTLTQWYNKIEECIFKGLDEYATQVSSCAEFKLVAPTFKWQMTKIGGGYSVWHTEQNTGLAANRALVWSIYLNDIQEGGETEFLYQHRKIKAEAGSLLIWPAGLTHPHRGNPPYSNDKFILTGWFEFPENEVYAELLTHALKSFGNDKR